MKTAKWPQVPGSPSARPQPTVSKGRKKRVSSPPGIRKRTAWERVNDCTWKLASTAEFVNVPACHGKWPGYRTTKAIAWVICVAPGQWLARMGNQASGPSQLLAAKAAAAGMVNDYEISDPITHLNGLAALEVDRG
jgi:hypothetical protein